MVPDVCEQEVEPDAHAFDAATVAGIVTKEDADCEGMRINFRGTRGKVQLPMQIDMGFGDMVFPRATLTPEPTVFSDSFASDAAKNTHGRAFRRE